MLLSNRKTNASEKGISPLIAAVLLIGVTMAIAGILASWATQYATARTVEFEKTGQRESACSGGTIKFISGYPKMDGGKIIAVIEVGGTALGNFSFNIILINNSAVTARDALSAAGAPGSIVSISSENLGLDKNNITQLRVASNCTSVTSLWTTLY